MVAIKDFEMPKSCLLCRKRKCLHIDGKAYQLCGLCEDGYLRESWFNSENVPKDCRSEHCPLKEVEAIPIPQDATNEDILKAVFPNDADDIIKYIKAAILNGWLYSKYKENEDAIN